MCFCKCAVHIAYCYRCCQCTSISICDRNIVVTCCKSCNVFCGCCKSSRSCPCIRKCSCCTGHCKIYRSIVHSTTRKCYCIGLSKCIGCLCYCYRYRKYTSIGICYCQVVVTCGKSCNIFCCCCKSSRSCPCICKCSCCTGHCKIYRSIIHSTTCKGYCIGLSKCICCLCYCYCHRKYASIGISYCKAIVSCCKTYEVLTG